MKILLNGTLGSIYLLRAESLFFVEFILKIEDFLSLSESRSKFQGTKPIKYSLHVQQNVIILVHFQHIEFILTSSEPTKYLPLSHIFM